MNGKSSLDKIKITRRGFVKATLLTIGAATVAPMVLFARKVVESAKQTIQDPSKVKWRRYNSLPINPEPIYEGVKPIGFKVVGWDITEDGLIIMKTGRADKHVEHSFTKRQLARHKIATEKLFHAARGIKNA